MNKQFIKKAAYNRKAIKTFDSSKKIKKEDFDFLLEIARLTPSSFGLEPWNILVIQNQELRKKLMPVATGAQRQLATSSHFIIFTVKTDLTPYSKYFNHINQDVKKLDIESCESFIESFSAFCAQKLDLYDERTRLDWAKKQAYIALGNIMLAAAEIGIDSCPIEGFFPNKVEEILIEEGIIDIATDRVAVMIALGYRDNNSMHDKSRRNISEIVKYVL